MCGCCIIRSLFGNSQKCLHSVSRSNNYIQFISSTIFTIPLKYSLGFFLQNYPKFFSMEWIGRSTKISTRLLLWYERLSGISQSVPDSLKAWKIFWTSNFIMKLTDKGLITQTKIYKNSFHQCCLLLAHATQWHIKFIFIFFLPWTIKQKKIGCVIVACASIDGTNFCRF